MTIVIAVIAVLLLLAFWLLFMAVARDNRVSREPSEFELAARRMNESMVQVQIAFADALTPALKRAADAMTEFHKAMTRADHSTGIEPK